MNEELDTKQSPLPLLLLSLSLPNLYPVIPSLPETQLYKNLPLSLHTTRTHQHSLSPEHPSLLPTTTNQSKPHTLYFHRIFPLHHFPPQYLNFSDREFA